MSSSRRKQSKRYRLYAVLLLAIVGGVAYLLFWLPALHVQRVHVEGVDGSDADAIHHSANIQLSGRSRFVVPHRAMVLVDEVELTDALRSAFPYLRIEEVDLRWFRRRLVVRAVRRAPAGIACRVVPLSVADTTADPFSALSGVRPEACYFFDEAGVLYRLAPESRGSLIVTLYIGSIDVWNMGQLPLAEETMQWLFSVNATLRDQRRIEITRFLIPQRTAGIVHAETTEGWRAVFTTAEDPPQQLRALVAVLGEIITPRERENLDYIDVRIPGRVYYR